jgi:hypothetical protein
VLTLREGELDSRLKDRERDIEELRQQLHALRLTTRKDQATIDSQARRVKELEVELLSLKTIAALQLNRKQRTKTSKVVKKAKRQRTQVTTKQKPKARR